MFDPGVVVVLRIEIVVEFALPIVFTLFCRSTVHFWRLMQVETQNTGLDIKYNILKAGLLVLLQVIITLCSHIDVRRPS